MKIINELSIILCVYLTGELLNNYILKMVPGTVLGLVLLLILLITKVVKVKQIETTSVYLLKNLSFFFVPASVGLIMVLDVVKDNLIAIMVIMVVSTIIVTITTGLTVQFLKKVMKK